MNIGEIGRIVVDVDNPEIGVTVFDLTGSNPMAVAMVDDDGIQISSFDLVGLKLQSISDDTPIVEGGGYLAISTAAANWGGQGGDTERHFITINNEGRIRQDGIVDHFDIYFEALTNLTGFWMEIWRKNTPGTWDRIYQENVFSKLYIGVCSIYPTVPWGVREGDFVGYGYTASTGQYWMTATISQATASTYFTATAPTQYGYDWTAQTANTSVLPLKVYLKAPQVSLIGDSIIAGRTLNASYCENSTTLDAPSGTIGYALAKALGCDYQNMGIGSQTTTQIAARITADAVNIRPKICVLEGGVNDISGGSISQSTFIANWTTMLNACVSAGIIPVVIKIMPWTNGTNTQLTTRDTWNSALAVLVATYPTAVIVDVSTYVGVDRVGGSPTPPVPNYWDIQTAYNADGTHYNAAGHAQIARAILDQIGDVTIKSEPTVRQGTYPFVVAPHPNATFPVSFAGGVDTELTAAVAMADDVSNPTIVQVAAFNTLYDPEGNWDRVRAIGATTNVTAADSGIQAVGLVAQVDDTSPTSITENQFGNVRMSSLRALLVGGEAIDDSAWTVGTMRPVGSGFLADDASPDSVDEGDLGIARMSLDRIVYTEPPFGTGTTRTTDCTNASTGYRITTSSTRVHNFILQATGTNQGTITWGWSSTYANNKMELRPGASVELHDIDISLLYFGSTVAGDDINYSYTI